ncbi:MAG TPA: AAA family ATPase [Polyangia bacterium]|jgi:hypothetical protein|nr:AAA family ATPase [Polyangia bacterium]
MERFEIDEQVGRGGARTFRARERQTGAQVALKLLPQGLTAQGLGLLIEAGRTLAALHPASIALYTDHGQTLQGQTFVIRAWLEGEDLGARLARQPPTVAESLILMKAAATALAESHRHGLVHGNLKPSNLILRDAALEHVVLVDFGLMHGALGERTLGGAGEIVNALPYMAPEQARGERQLGPGMDVFSLGCMLYECLVGRPPFAGRHVAEILARVLCEEALPIRRLRPELPEALEALVGRMLAKDQRERPADGSAVLAELAGLPANEASLASPISPVLGEAEQRLVSLILVLPRSRERDAAGRPGGPEASPPMSDLPALQALLRPYGAHVERLADGSLLATLRRAGQTATDQAAQAARAALALREELAGPAVALTMGRAVSTGSESLSAAIPRAVELARTTAEEDAANRGAGSVWLDELTAGLLDTRFRVRRTAAGRLALGRERPDEVRLLLGRPTPCVGRSRELRTLEMSYEACAQGEGARAIVLLAPAGGGKSRLRHEFVRGLEEHRAQAQLLVGRGDLMRAGTTYGLLADALLEAAGLRGPGARDDLAWRRERLRENLGRHIVPSERQRVVEFLGELCSIPFPDEDSPRLSAARQDPRLMSEQVLGAWLDFLQAECEAHPVVLILEDLHWSDAATVRMVDAALRVHSERSLLVLALGRPEVTELFPGLWRERALQEVHLSGLSRKASEQLVREVLGGQVAAEVVARIVEPSGGSPLFLEELIRAEAEGQGGEGNSPGTVLAMLETRFQRLESSGRRVLRAASIFGETFWRGGLLRLLGAAGRSADEVQGWLEQLERVEIIVRERRSRFPGEVQFCFRHTLLRDAAYGLLGDEDRQVGHRLAGEYLEGMGESDPVLLAEHFQLGGERVRAARCYVRAARRALESSDVAGALDYCARGVASGAAGETLGQLRALEAWSSFWGGSTDIEHTRAAALAAVELLPAGSADWYWAAGLVPVVANVSRPDVIFDIASRLTETRPQPGAESAFLEPAMCMMAIASSAGLREMATSFLERMRAICARLASGEMRSRGLLGVGEVWYRLLLEGDPWGTWTAAQAAVEAFARAGDRRLLCTMRGLAGVGRALLGDLARAEEDYRFAVALAEELREPMAAWPVHAHFVFILADAGEPRYFDEAERRAQEGLEFYPVPTAWGGLAHLARALVARGRGHLAEAEARIRRAMEMLAYAPPVQPLGYAIEGRVLFEMGRIEEARQAVENGMRVLEGALGGTCFMDTRLYLTAVEIRRAAGDEAGARRALEQGQRLLERRVQRIPDEAARRRFCEKVPEYAQFAALLR